MQKKEELLLESRQLLSELCSFIDGLAVMTSEDQESFAGEDGYLARINDMIERIDGATK